MNFHYTALQYLHIYAISAFVAIANLCYINVLNNDDNCYTDHFKPPSTVELPLLL